MHQGALAGTAYSRHGSNGMEREFDTDILQVILTSAFYSYVAVPSARLTAGSSMRIAPVMYAAVRELFFFGNAALPW